MSSTYSGNAGSINAGTDAQIVCPADADPRNAASVNTPLQKLADLVAWLRLGLEAQRRTHWRVLTLSNLSPMDAAWVKAGSAYSLFVAVGANGASEAIQYSSDGGTTWSSVAALPTGKLNSVAVNSVGTQVVAVGDGGRILHCSNLATPGTWAARSAPGASTANLQRVEYLGGQWIAVGASSAIWTSPDGITWTARTAPAAGKTYTGIALSGSRLVIVGGDTASGGYSDNAGVAWTLVTLPAAMGAIGAGNSRYLAAGTWEYYTSTDGIAWSAMGATSPTVKGAGANLNGFVGYDPAAQQFCVGGQVLGGIGTTHQVDFLPMDAATFKSYVLPVHPAGGYGVNGGTYDATLRGFLLSVSTGAAAGCLLLQDPVVSVA